MINHEVEILKYFINTNSYRDTSFAEKEVRRAAKDFGFIEVFDRLTADLAISIGGDGTFIDTTKCCMDADIIGINKGTLGYLAEIDENATYDAIAAYAKGNYVIQKRMMIASKLQDDGSHGFLKGIALNDICVVKDESSVIDLEIIVNESVVTRYYADGVIISTPTGSTGYAFSCGAPIIDPSSEMMIITPIAPHTVMNRSICVGPNSIVKVRLVGARGCNYCKLSIDGKNYVMKEGSAVEIKKSDKYINMVKFPSASSFLDRIRLKMG